jgi:hypothetical protein
MVGAALKLSMVWAILRGAALTPRACVLAGTFGGLAYLVRYDAIGLLLGVGLAVMIVNLDRESLRRRAAKAGLFACGALMVAAPWLVINWRTQGSPLAGSGYLLVATEFYAPEMREQLDAALREAEPDDAVAQLEVAARFHSMRDVVANDPVGFLRRYLHNLYWHGVQLGTRALGFPSYLLAPLGLVLLLRDPSRRLLAYLLVCVVGYLFLGLVRFVPRYYLFLLPLLFGAVAYVLFDLLPRARHLRKVEAPAKWLVLLAATALLSVSAYRSVSLLIATEPRYLFAIAEFLRRRSSPGEKIIARKPHLAYLSGLVNTFPFVDRADAYLKEARERGARFIVYSPYEAWLWPGLRGLRDPLAVPDGLKAVYTHPPTRTVVYEVEAGPKESTPRTGR